MALMEADRRNPGDARDAAGAMINRAAKDRSDLGEHVSGAIYQPTIEPAQQARLASILQSPEYADLSGWAERRAAGKEPDPVNGATHFLAPEATMLALERQNPGKYKNWGPRGANWTGYDPATGSYPNVLLRDGSHAFLAPDGSYSAPSQPQQANVAQNGAISGGQPPPTPQGSVPAPQPSALAAQPAVAPDTSSIVAQLFGSGQPETPQPQGPVASVLSGLSVPDTPQQAPKQDQQASALQPIPLPELPQSMRRPVDLSRLKEVLASRARLGTA